VQILDLCTILQIINTHKEVRAMQKGRRLFFSVMLSALLLAGCQGENKESQKRAEVGAVEKVLQSAEIGDLIVASNKDNTYFMFLVPTAKFDGSRIYGESLVYTTSYNGGLGVGDFRHVMGGDGGKIYVVPKKNVNLALRGMISAGTTYMY